MAGSFKLNITESKSDSSSNVLNLSNYPLSTSEIDLLDRGLTFVPTPKISIDSINQSVADFKRKLKIHDYFSKRPNVIRFSRTEFTEKSKWTPTDKCVDEDILKCINAIDKDIQNLTIQKEKSNLSKNESKTLFSLKRKTDIVIKKADKGSTVVVMNKSDYIKEGLRQLSNRKHYVEINSPLYPETATKITSILQDLHESKVISDKQLKFLQPPDEPRPRRFYMLPKIHKDKESWPSGNMPPGRPIVSDCNSESEDVASFIDAYIKTRASGHPSYIKNTYDFLDKISEIDLQPNSLLISLDVESMYTNIDHDEGLSAIKQTFSDCVCLMRF